MVHPRWWLNGPSIHSTNWIPFYPAPGPYDGLKRPPYTNLLVPQAPPPPQDPSPQAPESQTTPLLINQLAQLRGYLDPQERYRFDVESARVEGQISRYTESMISALLRNTQRSYQLQQTPFNQPDPVRQSYLARRNPHGRANERALLASEMADRRRRQERSRELQQARQQETQETEQLMDEILEYTLYGPRPFKEGEDTIEIRRRVTPESIPESPPRSLPISLPIRTPEKPRPRRTPSPDSPEALWAVPPASTAPAALDRRPKRRRQRTARLQEGRQQGFIPESQDRE